MEGDDGPIIMPFQLLKFIRFPTLELPLLLLFLEVGALVVAPTALLVGASGDVGAPFVAGRRLGDATDGMGAEVVPVGAAGTAVILDGEIGAVVLPVGGAGAGVVATGEGAAVAPVPPALGVDIGAGVLMGAPVTALGNVGTGAAIGASVVALLLGGDISLGAATVGGEEVPVGAAIGAPVVALLGGEISLGAATGGGVEAPAHDAGGWLLNSQMLSLIHCSYPEMRVKTDAGTF